jgi:hypothetical protein
MSTIVGTRTLVVATAPPVGEGERFANLDGDADLDNRGDPSATNRLFSGVRLRNVSRNSISMST